MEGLDLLLELLSNSTRRRMLRLLAERPRYLLELSSELGVSKQAVLKHLRYMESRGILEKIVDRSTIPPRKYYRLKEDVPDIFILMGDRVISECIHEEDEVPRIQEIMRRLEKVTELSSEDEIEEIIRELVVLVRYLARSRRPLER
ncbi:ArsR/SmtB family transcription factor [Candidatus Methanodesulfokora washburnensis]|jgi:predicted transcriptional regulator|uniref:ArsR family transcriptional regulator n=1 Tax=Candidatus Methanodesulfokora washburnensis TaxID=2478471 RepID=A0A429GJW2_9CREN|nr:helix-turn-helix domain-containing protein [Candidatus Methanodesulfokores washburnensis]RSN74117.1 ArsR family transcriptional regulator [Candidatus Methanodesulfokores washburnensis]